MAGYMYLGNKKVCPAIVVKQGTPYIPAYSIIDGKLTFTRYELTGHEFDGAEVAESGWFNLTESYIYGDAIFRDLKTIGGFAFSYTFSWQGIETASFEKVDTIGQQAFMYCFSDCYTIRDIYFNSLKTTSFGSYTNQFIGMLSNTGTSVIHTIHFPSNLESTIQGLSGYPLFGGTIGYVVLAFDLPATS